VHGTPIHFGDPAAIGIADIVEPEYGAEPDIRPGEVPLFSPNCFASRRLYRHHGDNRGLKC
jgi:uncharacterized protein YcsI (UPF0317 family)